MRIKYYSCPLVIALMIQAKKHKMILKETTGVPNNPWLCAKVKLFDKQVRIIRNQVTIIQNRVPLIRKQVRVIRNKVPIIGEQVRLIRKRVCLIQNKVSLITNLFPKRIIRAIYLKMNFSPIENGLAYNLKIESINNKKTV